MDTFTITLIGRMDVNRLLLEGLLGFLLFAGALHVEASERLAQSVLLFVKEAFGGILIALALSIPPGPERGIIVFVTYMVVAFSIVVHGLTLKKMLRHWEGQSFIFSFYGCRMILVQLSCFFFKVPYPSGLCSTVRRCETMVLS